MTNQPHTLALREICTKGRNYKPRRNNMKKHIIAALCIAGTLAPIVALADTRDDRGSRPDRPVNSGERGDRPDRPDRPTQDLELT